MAESPEAFGSVVILGCRNQTAEDVGDKAQILI